MFAKSSVELVKSAIIYGSDDFESPVAYVIVLAMFVRAPGDQVRWNRGVAGVRN